QLPDLIDKPLAWTFGLIPSGRSLAHSLVFLAGLSVIVWLLATRSGRRPEAGAFLVGYLTHVLADVLPAALAGEWAKLGTLLWPITPVFRYPDELDRSIIGFFLELRPAELVSLELGVTIVAFALWVVDGAPGIGTAVRFVRRRVERLRA
ncbi:metal-dependent hydrolase, partial [Halorubrum lipolyticum]